ncbi:MAG: oligosaccharide flippase family protein [Chloroflexi bacterium]|nr:oligosaccharide flippase family protein [Chloroflexota bacterium]
MDAKRPNASAVLVSGSAASLLANLIDLLFSLFILPLMVAELGKEHYGIWTLIGQTIGFLVLSNLGVSNAVGRFVARARARGDAEELNAVVSSSFLMMAFSGLVILLASLLLLGPLPGWLGIQPADHAAARVVFLINAGTLALALPMRIGAGILSGYQHYGLVNGMQTLYSLGRVAGVLALLAAGRLSLVPLAWALSAASLLQYLALLVIGLRIIGGVRPRLERASLPVAKEVLGLGLASMVLSSSSSLYREGIVLAAGPLLGPSTAGVYGVVLTVVTRISGLLSQLGNPLLTLASEAQARGDMKQLRALSDGVLRVTFALGVSAAAGLAVFGEPALRLWLGGTDWTPAEYQVAAQALTLMSAALAVGLPQLAARSLLQGVGKHWVVSWGFLLASLGGLGLAVWGMRNGWGLLGAAAGWSFVLLAQGVFIYPPMLLRALEQTPGALLRAAYLPGFLVGLAVWGASAGMAAWFPPGSPLNLLFGVGVGFLAGLAGLAAVSQYVRKRLLRILRIKKK